MSPRDRSLLSLRYAHGADVEALARMYQVHRVTMSRWLSDARDQLREELMKRLEPGQSDQADLRHWLGTHPELSLARLLAITRL